MSEEVAKLRAYPRTRRAWAREVDGVERLLRSLPRYRAAGQVKWAERMEAYYSARLKLLYDRGPPKVRPKVKYRGKHPRRLRG